MDLNEFEPLDKCLNSCRDIDLDVILRHNAEIQNLRLMHELKIRTFLKDKFHHDNYKEIKKDIKKLEDMLAQAHALDIELDNKLVEDVNGFTDRLLQERNMRKSRDLMLQNAISTCGHADVKKLNDLVDGAKANNVEPEYVEASEKLLT